MFMPTRNVVLTKHQEEFIETMIENGHYQNASEILREGLRLVENNQRSHAARLQAFKDAVQIGEDAFDRGEYRQFSDVEGLSAYLREATEHLIADKGNE
jgi:antitoxin ParD1/3/4